jgi:salicylate hydroxylase
LENGVRFGIGLSTGGQSSLLLADITVGIVGAGLGGLALALALRRMGFPSVRIFEAASNAEAVDEPNDQLLELTANGSRVLHALGLESELRANAFCPGFAYLRTRRSGFLLTQRPLGDFSEARYGAPTYLISYLQLLALLRQAATARGVEIHYNAEIIDLQPHTGTLQPHNAPAETFAAVIVADGADASLHNIISSESVVQTSAAHSIRARCDLGSQSNAVSTWLDDSSYCVQYPVNDAETELMLVYQDDQHNPAGEDPATQNTRTPEQILNRWIESGHPELKKLINHVDSVEQLRRRPGQLTRHWHAGYAALLGDACHPLPGYEPQSANTTLEDVWVLATMMERWEEAPHQGFSDYQRFRQPRMHKLLKETARATTELLSATPSEQFRRNFKWSVINRFLPEVSMAQWDWLYGYNCIKGFA